MLSNKWSLCALALLLAGWLLPLLPAQSTKEKPALLQAPFGEAKAKEAQQVWAKHLGRKVEEEVDLGGGVKLEIVLIPPGTFTMGSPKTEKQPGPDEDAHKVTLTKPFFLGKYEVTQEQYERLAGRNPSWFSPAGGGKKKVAGQDPRRFPVENVSWEDATKFCDKLGAKAGRKVALPTEAQWEWACRAGTTTAFHFGSQLNGKQANCNGQEPYGTEEKGPDLERTCRVGSYAPNAFGLYDMHGNVSEWCLDWYGPYQGLSTKDPLRADKGSGGRVQRGGSWYTNAVVCRAANRYDLMPATRFDNLGFRVCFGLE